MTARRADDIRLRKLREAEIAREKAEIEDWQLIHAQLCYDSFAYFVRSFWYVNEPTTPLVWGWWLDQICEAVQKQAEGDPAYRWLLVMQPYGTAKSRIMSVLKPAWRLLRNPSARMLYIGTSDSVVTRDSRYTREIMKSSGWEDLADKVKRRGGYREVVALLHAFGQKAPKGHPLYRYPLWDFAKDQDEKGNFATNRGGYRLCAPMGGDVMGQRGDDVTIDDPVGFEDTRGLQPSAIAAHMRSMDIKARYVYSTRVNDRELSTRTMVMQRLDPEDPAGTALRDGHWKVICVPMEYDANHPLIEHMANDPRTQTGDVLVGWYIDPVTGRRVVKPLLTEATKKQALRDLGATQYEAQNNQKPRRMADDLVRREWFTHTYRETPQEAAASCDKVELWIDPSVKGKDTSDDCGMLVVGFRAGQVLALDDLTGKMSWTRLKGVYRHVRREKWPMIRAAVIEDKASGSQLKEQMDGEGFTGNVIVNPGRKSKPQRWDVNGRPWFEGGSVLYPLDEPWVAVHIDEMLSFDGRDGGTDNRVDCWSMGLGRWGQRHAAALPAGPLSTALTHALEDGLWDAPVFGHRYIITAAAWQGRCAWTVIDLNVRREAGCGVVDGDPREMAKALRRLAQDHFDATIVVDSLAAGVVTALYDLHCPRVWSDAAAEDRRPGWTGTPARIEKATAALAQRVDSGELLVRSRSGLVQLLAHQGGTSLEDGERVRTYQIAAEVMGQILLPKTPEQQNWRKPGGVRVDFFKDRDKASSL